nr:MAG TPA: hypothetical protein [Caudoviricetes sp.]
MLSRQTVSSLSTKFARPARQTRSSAKGGLTELTLLSMSKLQKIIAVATIVVVTLGLISRLVAKIDAQKETIERQERNISGLASEVVSYVTKLGDAAEQKQALELSHKELKSVNADLHKEISALKLRIKDVQSAVRTGSTTEVIETVRVDTINKIVTAEYRDAWNTIKSEQIGDSAKLSYIGRDTIVGVVSIQKKRFLFFRWGLKKVNYDISNKNPKTKISIDVAVRFK